MAQSLRRVVLAAMMVLVVLLFASGARVGCAILEDMDLPLEVAMPPIRHVESRAASRLTETQLTNTLRMLLAFADVMPGLKSSCTGTPSCDWPGITCYQGSVYLGPMTPNFTGTLPDVPEDADEWSMQLDTISFYNLGSVVSGTLLNSWYRLTSLAVLNFAFTNVCGTLLASWGALTQIKFPALFSTSVGGTLPVAWAGLSSLTTLAMHGMQVTGTLQLEWSALTARTMVQLQRCKFQGSLPASWLEMPSPTCVVLNNNDFCGCVLEYWKEWTRNCATELKCRPTMSTALTTTSMIPESSGMTRSISAFSSTARPWMFAAMMKMV